MSIAASLDESGDDVGAGDADPGRKESGADT
jgi:hypothetical protein